MKEILNDPDEFQNLVDGPAYRSKLEVMRTAFQVCTTARVLNPWQWKWQQNGEVIISTDSY